MDNYEKPVINSGNPSKNYIKWTRLSSELVVSISKPHWIGKFKRHEANITTKHNRIYDY